MLSLSVLGNTPVQCAISLHSPVFSGSQGQGELFLTHLHKHPYAEHTTL